MNKPTDVLAPLTSTVSWYSIAILVLSVGATLVCFYTNTVFEMRLDILGLAVVFPLVFSINSAFQRREQALRHLALMKSNAYTLRFAFYHWMEGKFLTTSGPQEIDAVLLDLFKKIAEYFKSDDFTESDYMQIMAHFSAISWLIEIHLRQGGVPAPNLARIEETLRTIMSQFELMRIIKQYRTPLALRAYTKLFVSIFPILYAPLFALVAQEQLWGALVMVVLYALVLTGLDAIQDGLEEPFDGLGIDDVHFVEYPKHIAYPVITPGHTELHLKAVYEGREGNEHYRDNNTNGRGEGDGGGGSGGGRKPSRDGCTVSEKLVLRDCATGVETDLDLEMVWGPSERVLHMNESPVGISVDQAVSSTGAGSINGCGDGVNVNRFSISRASGVHIGKSSKGKRRGNRTSRMVNRMVSREFVDRAAVAELMSSSDGVASRGGTSKRGSGATAGAGATAGTGLRSKSTNSFFGASPVDEETRDAGAGVTVDAVDSDAATSVDLGIGTVDRSPCPVEDRGMRSGESGGFVGGAVDVGSGGGVTSQMSYSDRSAGTGIGSSPLAVHENACLSGINGITTSATVVTPAGNRLGIEQQPPQSQLFLQPSPRRAGERHDDKSQFDSIL